MESEFWLQRWRENRIGFHRDTPMPSLAQYWPALAVPAATRVLVPLAGKSLDMCWLANHGYRVLGVELSPVAIRQFLDEHHLNATTTKGVDGTRYHTTQIDLIEGNAFTLTAETLAECHAIYDRAALIALPPEMRERYAREVYTRLAPGCRGLLITLDYPAGEMAGPPFSVDEQEVRRLLGKAWSITPLERRDIIDEDPDFRARGVTALHTAVYQLERLP